MYIDVFFLVKLLNSSSMNWIKYESLNGGIPATPSLVGSFLTDPSLITGLNNAKWEQVIVTSE